MEPCPFESINLSRFIQLGLRGLCFKYFLHKTFAMSAIPIGAPGCPDFAFCTASALKNLTAFDIGFDIM